MSKRFTAEIVDGRARALFGDDRPQSVQGAREGAIVIVEGDQVAQELAPPGSAKAALYRIAANHGLDPVFPQAVRDEVTAWQADPQIDDPDLDDLTALPFVTIDGTSSRDLDQAVHVATEGDGFLVRYALADAAHYVKPGTALFDEALRRGASYYLPGMMVPMLPRALSEDLVSLNPDVDRRSMMFSMHCDAQGKCVRTVITRARIRSRAKLDWGGVQAFYDGGPGFGDDIDQSLRDLAELGRRRMALAEARGAIRYRRTEVGVKLDGKDGLRFIVTTDVRRAVERYNEQVSLLCNIEGAKKLRTATSGELRSDANVEPIYRVHPAPDEERLAAFERMLRALAKDHGLDPAVWVWSMDHALADFLDALPTEGTEGRIARAIHRQAVMLNVRSTFQRQPEGHYGVGAEVYARFSAPMREIVGVFLHEQIWEHLANDGTRDDAIRDAVVVTANRAKQTQRKIADEANRLVIDQLFASEKSFEGTVMGLTRGKIHVMLDAPTIDVKVYMRHQRRHMDAPLDLSAEANVIHVRGRVLCRLGDTVRVCVRGRDEKKDRWILVVEER